MARDTNFYLYKNVNLTLGSGDTFYFATRSAQNNFFASKLFQTISTCSYQRENRSYIKVPVGISNLYTVDYLAFINPSYENKRYYCFVTEINYISDSCTEIGYVVDFIQTWLLDANILPCFIERQHSRTDNIGDNLLEDNLETGDYIIREKMEKIASDTLIIIQATFDLKAWVVSNFQTKSGATSTSIKNGIYSALSETCVYSNYNGVNAGNDSALAQILENVFIGSGGVTIDDIVTMYVYPKIGISFAGEGTVVPNATAEEANFRQLWEFTNYSSGGIPGYGINLPVFPRNEDEEMVIGSYVPRNNKLFSFPFYVMHATNNNGSSVDWKVERFRSPWTPRAMIFGTSTAEGKIRICPAGYLDDSGSDSEISFEYGLDSAPYPTVAQLGDAYNIWLAQNRNYLENKYFDSMDLKIPFTDKRISLPNSTAFQESLLRTGNQAIGSLKQGQAGIGSMGVFGMNETMNTVLQVENFLAETRDRAIAPNTASGIQSVGLAFQNGKPNFSIYIKTIDEKHAKMIDDYFTMFGYPVKEIGQPAFYVRENFTYIKTVGAKVRGNLPEIAKQAIETGLNSGLRFWANPANIGDFSVSNNTLP